MERNNFVLYDSHTSPPPPPQSITYYGVGFLMFTLPQDIPFSHIFTNDFLMTIFFYPPPPTPLFHTVWIIRFVTVSIDVNKKKRQNKYKLYFLGFRNVSLNGNDSLSWDSPLLRIDFLTQNGTVPTSSSKEIQTSVPLRARSRRGEVDLRYVVITKIYLTKTILCYI